MACKALLSSSSCWCALVDEFSYSRARLLIYGAGIQMVFLLTDLTGNFLRIFALNSRLISAIERFLLESVRNQFSFKSSAAVIRLSAFMLNISFSMLRQSSDRSLLISLKAPRLIFRYNSASVYPLNGKKPFNRQKRRTPLAQMSAGGPKYSTLETISGAM